MRLVALVAVGMAAHAPAAMAGANDTKLEASQFSWPAGSTQTVTDSAASGGSATKIVASVTGTATVTTSRSSIRIAVTARGDQCHGTPNMTVTVDGRKPIADGQQVGQFPVAATTSYYEYAGDLYVAPGTHTIAINFTNYTVDSTPLLGCTRDLIVDTATLNAEPFAPTSYRNQPLADNAPIDPNSDALVGTLLNGVVFDSADNGVWMTTTHYAPVVYTVPPSQPTQAVTLYGCTSNPQGMPCSQVLQAKLNAVPMPSWAAVYPKDVDNDAPLVVYQPTLDRLWEFWDPRKDSSGHWTAGWGGYMGPDNTGCSTPCPTPVSQSTAQVKPGNESGNWDGDGSQGASASAIPYLAGVQRIAEAQAGVIDHVVAVSVPGRVLTRFSVTGCPFTAVLWPAQRSDGESTSCGSIPEGTRFRLPPGLDIDHLNPAMPNAYGRVVAKAVQKYGMVVIDRNSDDQSGAVSFFGERMQDISGNTPDAWSPIFGGAQQGYRCDHSPPDVFCNFPWQSLQVVAVPQNPF